MSKSGDCCVKHPGGFATGMGLVVSSDYHCLLVVVVQNSCFHRVPSVTFAKLGCATVGNA